MSGPGVLDPMALLGSLVLEDGRRWAEAAHDFQVDDARAVLDARPDVPRLHFITRPRGASKTTDLGGLNLVALLTQAPPRSASFAYARDQDQAGLLLEALAGLAQRSGLTPLLDIGTWGVSVRSSGAKLAVESADAASALGKIPFMVTVDELAAWPTTKGARTLWENIVSGLPKRPDSRLIAITSAGDPAHWSAGILKAARTSARWRVSETPGPTPWADPADLAEQARMLPESSYARLHLNRWVSGEDRLVRADDLAACVALNGPLAPDPAVAGYVIGLDLGLKSDRTVMVVCHAVPAVTADGRVVQRVVLDRIEVLSGTRERPVELAVVEDLVLQAAREYRAPVRTDPWQAVGLAQRLRGRGVRVEEWAFTAQSVGRLAVNLHLLLRERRLSLPDDAELLDELANVRLRETSPGVFRLDHDAGKHDDRAVALGLAALALTEKPPAGRGGITDPTRLTGPLERALTDATPALSGAAALRHAQRVGPLLPGGALLVPGSANDPRRVGWSAGAGRGLGAGRGWAS